MYNMVTVVDNTATATILYIRSSDIMHLISELIIIEIC